MGRTRAVLVLEVGLPVQRLAVVQPGVTWEVRQKVDPEVLQPAVSRVVHTRVLHGVDLPVLLVVTWAVLMVKSRNVMNLMAVVVHQRVIMKEVGLAVQFVVDLEALEANVRGVRRQMEPAMVQSRHLVCPPVPGEVNLVAQHTVNLQALPGVCLPARHAADRAAPPEVGVDRVHRCRGVLPEVRYEMDPKARSEIVPVVVHVVDPLLHEVGLPLRLRVGLAVQPVGLPLQLRVGLEVRLGDLPLQLGVGLAVRLGDPPLQPGVVLGPPLQLGVDLEVQLGVVPAVMHGVVLAVLPEVGHVVGREAEEVPCAAGREVVPVAPHAADQPAHIGVIGVWHQLQAVNPCRGYQSQKDGNRTGLLLVQMLNSLVSHLHLSLIWISRNSFESDGFRQFFTSVKSHLFMSTSNSNFFLI